MNKDGQIMKDLPRQEQPYEKCWDQGEMSLTDAELLCVILRTGSRHETAIDLSRRILRSIPGQSLEGLYHISLADLTKIPGIGKVKAIQLKCITELSRRIAHLEREKTLVFREPASVAACYMEDLRHEDQEKVMLLMLDTKGKLLAQKVISIGTVNASMISPREIFLTALSWHAVSIILMHNHPSGDPTPSDEDLALTRMVHSCGRMLGIELLDHIIIGDKVAVSLREQNCLS